MKGKGLISQGWIVDDRVCRPRAVGGQQMHRHHAVAASWQLLKCAELCISRSVVYDLQIFLEHPQDIL